MTAPGMTAAERIVIVEDHRLLAESVGLALSAEGYDVEIVDVSDADAVVTTVGVATPTLVLLDLELGPPVGDGTALIVPLCERGATVLVLTGVSDRMRLAAVLEAGAIGFLAKSAPFEVLLSTVVRAARRERVIEENDRLQMLRELRTWRAGRERSNAPFRELTTREREVLGDLVEGQSVEAIARSSFVSSATVRTQVRAILTKLGVNSQLAAVAKAHAAGWEL